MQNTDIKEKINKEIEAESNAVDDSSFLLCSDAIEIILEEHEYLERVDDLDNLIYCREGYDNNHFTFNYTNNTFILGHESHSYSQFYVDEYFYYRDMSDEYLKSERILLIVLVVYTKFIMATNRWNLLNTIHIMMKLK